MADEIPDLQEVVRVIEHMGDALAGAQAGVRAAQYVLMEVVRDLARNTQDPQAYLATMFERISERADQYPLENEAHPSTGEFRASLARFFHVARQQL